jgi:hypothetical protein
LSGSLTMLSRLLAVAWLSTILALRWLRGAIASCGLTVTSNTAWFGSTG